MLALVGLWELVAVTIASGHHVVPTPTAVVATLVRDRFYAASLVTTLWEAARGFFWGNLAALALAGVCVLVPPVANLLTRLAMMTYCIPTIAIAPLLIVLFSPDRTKVVMAGLSVFFPTLLGALLGLASAPRSALDFVHVSGGTAWFALVHVRLRAAVTATAGALSLAAPAAFVGAMIGEYLGGNLGLGVVLVQAQESLNVSRAWAVALLATLVSGLAYALIARASRRLGYTSTTTEMSLEAGGDLVRGGPWWVRVLRGAASVAAVLLAWYAAVRWLGLDPFLAKTPVQVWNYLTSGPHAGAHLALIATNLLETLRDAAVGFGVGTAAAVVAAGVFLSSAVVQAALLPVVMALRTVPLVAMTPLIALVFGRGVFTVAVIAGVITFVPTLVNLMAALRALPRPTSDLLHVYAVGWLRALLGVRMVYVLPAFAASARIAIPGALLGAVLSELIATGSGLGHLIEVTIASSEYVTLWAALAVVSAVSAALYMLVSAAESRALHRLGQ